MLAALALIVALPALYQSTLICSVKPVVWNSLVRCSVLTDQGLVAGYTCDSVGQHGETDLAKPFVWSKGKLHMLPLGTQSEYGHVFGGNDRLLVGSVSIDYKTRPATWTPDSGAGWSKAKLKVFDDVEGYATHIGPDGAIWVQKGNQVASRFHNNKWENVSLGLFSLKGIDAQGRLFGEKFSGIGYARRPANPEPGMFQGKTWTPFEVEKPSGNPDINCYIEAVTSKGVAVGNYRNHVAIWEGGKVSLILKGERQWSYAYDVNDAGDIVGRCGAGENGSQPFLWRDGALRDLTGTVPGFQIDTAVKINNRNDIAVTGRKNGSAHLYLLTRK